MSKLKNTVHIVGGGLAGSECALQLAHFGFDVVLHEMRIGKCQTPAHKTSNLAELVCSNSFGSLVEVSAPGELKWEALQLNSFILKSAHKARVPAGNALGIDREIFSELITKWIKDHPKIQLSSKVITSIDEIPRPAVIASGPLTHSNLAESMMNHFGNEFLYFYDAIAPVIDTDSIDMNIAWKANRYDEDSNDGDYINCPLNKEEYFDFIQRLKDAKKIEPKEFEKNVPYFESCLPIEVLASRGDRTLSFGPMKPTGLTNPRTGRWPYAVVQLRQDNKNATAYNMVGFQTKMAYKDQKEVFRTIPGLKEAEFLKLGSIHRNLFINSPRLLNSDLSSKKDSNLYFAGQITGVEGYFESTCIGLLVANFINQKSISGVITPPPRASALGSLLNAITLEEKINFQPTNINFGLFPPLNTKVRDKKLKKALMIQEAQNNFEAWKNGLKLESNKSKSLPSLFEI